MSHSSDIKKLLGFLSEKEEKINHQEFKSLNNVGKYCNFVIDTLTRKQYIVIGCNKTISVFDALTLKEQLLKKINLNDSLMSLATYFDNNILFVVTNEIFSNIIKVWNVFDGVCVKTLTGHTDHIHILHTFTNKKTGKVYIVSGGWDKTIKVWDTSNWTCIKTIQYTKRLIECIYSFNTFLKYEYIKKQLESLNTHTNIVCKDIITHYLLPYSYEPSTYILIGDSRNNLDVIDTSNWSCKSINCGNTYYSISSSTTYTDAKTGEVFIVIASDDKYTIKVLYASDGTCIKTLYGHTNVIWSLSTFTDEKTNKVYIISGSRDNTIKVWDTSLNNPCIKTLTGHTSDVTYVSTYTDPLTNKVNIVSGSWDNNIKIWDF